MELPIVTRARLRNERHALEVRLRKSERALAKTRRALERAKRGELDADPPIVALEYADADIRLLASSKSASKRRMTPQKEPFTVEWLHSLPAGEVLYDIGANVGAHSLVAARRPQGPMRVVAFEPGASTFAVLCSNIVLNDAAELITPLCVPLGDRTELGRFGYSDLTAGAALHAGGGDEIAREVVYWQPVLMYTLDDLVERFGLPRPEHLKLDVDGAELNVLHGAGGVLSGPRLRSMLVELNAGGEADVEEFLAGHGLHRAETYREGDGTKRPSYARFERS